MIVVSCVTDISPAMSLIYEHPEADLMRREPRSVTGERLVNPQLFLHAYLFTGTVNSLAAFGMFFYYMSSEAGIPPQDLFFAYDKFSDGFHGYTQDELNEILWTGQTIYFVTLVISNFGNLLGVRTRRLSFFQHNPFKKKTRNLKLFLAMFVSCNAALAVVYWPVFQDLFNSREIPWRFWLLPFCFALGLVMLDEMRKVIVRCLPWRIARRIFW